MKGLGIFALLLAIVSLVLFYSFQRQRRFPTQILGWIGISNILSMLLVCYIAFDDTGVLISGSSDDSSSTGGGGIAFNQYICSVLFALDQFFVTWDICCNTLLALTVYLTVNLNKQIGYHDNPNYLRYYLVFLFSWVIVFSVVAGLVPQTLDPACKPQDVVFLAALIPNLLLVFVQFTLLVMTGKKIHKVVQAVRIRSENATQEDKRLSLMIFRFVPTILAQLLVVLPGYIQNFIDIPGSVSNAAGASGEQAIFVCTIVATIIDATVLIVTNRSLWNRMKRIGSDSSTDSRGATDSSGAKSAARQSAHSRSASGKGFEAGNGSTTEVATFEVSVASPSEV